MSKTLPYQTIDVGLLELNTGQLEGLPKNPRFIKSERYTALKKSIEDAPELLEARTLLVYPLDNGHYIVIGGNMRLRACTELGFKELPCYVFPKETPVEKLSEYIIKDNVAFGDVDWNLIANEWDTGDLEDWGMKLPSFLEGGDFELGDFFDKEKEEEQKAEKEKCAEIKIVCPADFTDEQVDEVRKAVEEAVKDFEGLKIK